MTSCGTACQPRRRCPVAFAWNSIAVLRLRIGRWYGSEGQERTPALWLAGLRRHGAVTGRPQPERGFVEGRRDVIWKSASVAMSTLRRSHTGPSSSMFHRGDSAWPVVKDEYSDFGSSLE
eukprot:6191012-Pleurochrysis_carterae.AAC.2